MTMQETPATGDRDAPVAVRFNPVEWLPYGVALVRLVGPMVKYGRGRSGVCGTSEIRGTVRKLRTNPRALAILLVIDSPGGEVAGAADLASEVAEASAVKPVAAYIEDCGCSAAYWAASQCRAGVWCNSTARVGAVGAMLVVNDVTEGLKRAGIRTHLVASGKWKGLGVPGVPVGDEQIDYLHRQIAKLGAEFAQAVQSGRGLCESQMLNITQAGVFVGSQAVEAGLCDDVISLDAAIQVVQQLAVHEQPYASRPGRVAQKGTCTNYNKERSMDQQSDVPGSHSSDEMDALAEACRDKGIFTAELLKERIAMAELGQKHLQALRDSARREAVRCFGADAAPVISAQVDVLPAASVETLRTAWQTEADSRYGHAADGSAPPRASAPVPLPSAIPVRGDAASPPPTGWQSLSDEQRAFAGRMGMDTDERREAFAHTVLGKTATGGI